MTGTGALIPAAGRRRTKASIVCRNSGGSTCSAGFSTAGPSSGFAQSRMKKWPSFSFSLQFFLRISSARTASGRPMSKNLSASAMAPSHTMPYTTKPSSITHKQACVEFSVSVIKIYAV